MEGEKKKAMKWKTKNQQTQGQLFLPEPWKSHQVIDCPTLALAPCQTHCHLSTLFGRTYCEFHIWNWIGWNTCFLFFQLANNFLNVGRRRWGGMSRQSKSEEQGWPGFELHQENTKDKQQKKRPKVESEGEQKGKRKKSKQSRKQGFLGHSGGRGSPCKKRQKQSRHCHLSTQGFSTAKKRTQPHFPYNKHSLHFKLIQQEHFWSKRRKEKWKWKSLSRVWLFATPRTVHGIPQPRILERVAFPFSRGSSQLKVHSCLHWRKQPSRGPGISTITNSDLERSLFNHLILLPF